MERWTTKIKDIGGSPLCRRRGKPVARGLIQAALDRSPRGADIAHSSSFQLFYPRKLHTTLPQGAAIWPPSKPKFDRRLGVHIPLENYCRIYNRSTNLAPRRPPWPR